MKSVSCLNIIQVDYDINGTSLNSITTTFWHYSVCQPIDRCSETDHSYACQNGGTCTIDDAGQLTCKCHPQYTGQRCEIGKKTKITININQ